MMEIPTGCYPREFWRGMFNMTEAELNGQACVKLGIPGIIRLESCQCEATPRPFDPFQPFRIL